MNLTDKTKQYLIQRNFSAGKREGLGLYPSSVSIETNLPNTGKQILGTCNRAEFYKKTNVPVSDPNTSYTEFIFLMGKEVENMLVEVWKKMGVWVANSERFTGHILNLPVSGELDVVIRNPETNGLIGIECKSCYGYAAQKEIFGSKTDPGYPKISNLMQAFIYAYIFRPGNGLRSELEMVKLVYFARDSMSMTEFNITAGRYEDGATTDYYAEVNGKVDERISLQKIVNRQIELTKYLEANELPPRDFSIKYTNEQIENLYKDGMISESAFSKFKKGRDTTLANRPGDWQCAYCNHRSKCYSDQPSFEVPGWDLSKLRLETIDE